MTEPRSLFVFMHDSPAQWEDDLNRYFDFDHIQDRLSCQGWRGAERFVLSDAEPAGWNPAQRWTKYLYFHHVDSLDALTSRAREAFAAGSPWARAQREQQRPGGVLAPNRGIRTGWTQRPSPWLGATSYRMPPPRVIYVVLRDVEPDDDDAVNAYLDSELVPEMLMSPGFLHCERYEAGPALPATPGSDDVAPPRYLDIFDIASPEVLSSESYRLRSSSLSARGRALSQPITVRGAGVYVQRSSPWMIEPWNPHAPPPGPGRG
jgi:hypothetical protein